MGGFTQDVKTFQNNKICNYIPIVFTFKGQERETSESCKKSNDLTIETDYTVWHFMSKALFYSSAKRSGGSS